MLELRDTDGQGPPQAGSALSINQAFSFAHSIKMQQQVLILRWYYNSKQIALWKP